MNAESSPRTGIFRSRLVPEKQGNSHEDARSAACHQDRHDKDRPERQLLVDLASGE